MKRIFLAIIFILIPSTICSDEPDKNLHNKCLYPSIAITSPDINAVGSGVIVRSEKVDDVYHNVALSIAHVFAEKSICHKVKIWKYKDWSTIDGCDEYDCFIYQKDEKKDLAIIFFVSPHKLPEAELDVSPKLYIGSKIFRLGAGLGDEIRLDYGRITTLNAKLPDMMFDLYRTSVYSVLGDSGGPVFHEYKVVGLVQSIRATRIGPFPVAVFGISYAVPTYRLKKWNKELDNIIGFVYDKNEDLPVSPFELHKAASLKISPESDTSE
jgi:S1-C subfamily serine protease